MNTVNERGRTLLHLLFQNEHLMVPKGESEPNEQLLLQNVDLLFKAGVSVDARDNGSVLILYKYLYFLNLFLQFIDR